MTSIDHLNEGCNGKLLWAGSSTRARRASAPLERLGFSLQPMIGASIPDVTDVVAVLILLDKPGNDDERALLSATVTALNQGVNSIFVLPESSYAHYPTQYLNKLVESRGLSFRDHVPDDPNTQQSLDPLPLRGAEVRRCGSDTRDIVRALHPRPPPLVESITVHSMEFGLGASHDRLLRLAFGDCERIVCHKLAGGLSGADVAEIRALKHGNWLTPFVAKFASRRDTFKAVRLYEHHVRDFVPFRGRPSLVAARSLVLGDLGVVTGRFVERGVPLLEAVQQDHGVELLNDLFGTLLRRWWSNSQIFPTQVLSATGDTTLLRWIKHPLHSQPDQQARLASIYERTAAQFSVVHPALIHDCFDHELSAVRVGKIHGDLSARNVLGQATRAIVIDFADCASAPVLLDPAWLEVTLAFHWLGTVHPDCTSLRSPAAKKWRTQIDSLYTMKELSHHPTSSYFSSPHSPFESVCNAIHAIRCHAHSIATDRRHYAYCVLAALVRLASLKSSCNTVAGTYAYRIASGLARDIQQNAHPHRVAQSLHKGRRS